jgi:phosphoenolpyruvate carboxykinase (ATP)
MTHHPSVYANLFRERIERHGVACWLVNTGWLGGACGAGTRIPIALTRALLEAALEGRLAGVPFARDPVFGLQFPRAVPGVSGNVLDPRAAWPDPAAYDRQAADLARLFAANFAAFAMHASDGVRESAVTLPSL